LKPKVGKLTKLNIQAEQLNRIRNLAKIGKARTYRFLGYTLDLDTGEFQDTLKKVTIESERDIQIMTALLIHYSLAIVTPKVGRLLKFKDLPGGYAYENAFTQRAIKPIQEAFGSNPLQLAEAAELLGGKRLDYGDLSVEISAFEGISIVYLLWAENEFSASANVLFDESASYFLDTECLASLGELTTRRLLKAQSILI
jgi:hypothetical protein